MPDINASPPLRADARRNRDALLVAARAVFAESGLDAPLDAIAKRAGVGRATLYRRFPTRDDLISAIFDDDFGVMSTVASSATDPSRAYFEIMSAAMDLQAENLGFIELFTRRPPAPEVLDAINGRFYAVIEGPLRAAQDAGYVRKDLLPSDAGTLLLMIGAATANVRAQRDGELRRERAISLLLDAVDPASAPRTLAT